MGIWKFYGGRIWQNSQLKNNDVFMIEVNQENNKTFELDDDDVITPGFYDIHCHIWGQKDAFGKGSLISLSPGHLLSTGIFGCADAGSYGYYDWLEANRLWRQSSLAIKSWINILPESLTTPEKPYTLPEAIDQGRLLALCQEHRDSLLGIKFMHGLANGDQEKERAWLRIAHNIARQAKTAFMVHMTGSTLDIRETLEMLEAGDIISHAYNYGGPGGVMLDKNGEIIPEVLEAKKRGVLFDMAPAFRHFSFKVYNKAHIVGLDPDFIATDNNIRDYRKMPMKDIVHLLSQMIAAGMDYEAAFQAAIDTPRKYMGFGENYKENMVILKYVQTETIYQDTILRDPPPIYLKSDWTYKAKYGVYRNECIFMR